MVKRASEKRRWRTGGRTETRGKGDKTRGEEYRRQKLRPKQHVQPQQCVCGTSKQVWLTFRDSKSRVERERGGVTACSKELEESWEEKHKARSGYIYGLPHFSPCKTSYGSVRWGGMKSTSRCDGLMLLMYPVTKYFDLGYLCSEQQV